MAYHRHGDAFQTGDRTRSDPRIEVRRRPNPREWLWYAFGGGLPPQLSQWVLRDTTGQNWWVRHIGRALLQMAPLIAAVVTFLPGPLDLRIYCAVLGFLTGLIWALSTMWSTTEHRLIKAGFTPGEAEQARAERADVAKRRHQQKYGQG